MRLAKAIPAEQLQSAAARFRLAARWRNASHRPPRGPLRDTASQVPGSPTAKTPESDDQNLGQERLEAVLFLAREPLPARKLSQFAGLEDGTAARTLMRRLNQGYDASGRSFRIEEVAGGYQLLSRPKFGRWLRRLGHVPAETRLSAPALETLAVVAYRQPVPRAEIEAVRGVSCGEVLRLLMERDLVRICGRSEELGRPYLYGTTRRFLQTFGLRGLDDLPRAASLRVSPLRASVAATAASAILSPDET